MGALFLFSDGHKYTATGHPLPEFYLQNSCNCARASPHVQQPVARQRVCTPHARPLRSERWLQQRCLLLGQKDKSWTGIESAGTASITASATFGHSASPDSVSCWHIMDCNEPCRIVSSVLTFFVIATRYIPSTYRYI